MATGKVLLYDAGIDCHVVAVDGEMFPRRFDLMVSGRMPKGVTAEGLVGRTVEWEWEHPYIALAECVTIKPMRAVEDK